MAKEEKPKVITPEFRLSFPNLFKARAAKQGDKPFFSLQMLFDKDADLKAMKLDAMRAAIDKWGSAQNFPKNMKSPFIDGDTKDLESHKGKIVVNAKTEFQTPVVDQNRDDIINPADVYPGMYGRARVSAYAYDFQGNRGVAFGLLSFQKMRDGEKLGFSANPKDDFSVVELKDDAADLSAFGADNGGSGGATDEIPF